MYVAGPLGRNFPKSFDHVHDALLSDLALELQPTFRPVTFGINWYSAFDTPTLGTDGKYYLATKRLGYIRGGHAITGEPLADPAQPGMEQDLAAWHKFYNQLREGACEGFSHARALSIIKRKTYDAFWVYDDARRVEGRFPSGEGAENQAVCEALEKWGAHPEEGTECKREPWIKHSTIPTQEIGSYRFLTSAEEVWATLGLKSNETMSLLNSWGEAYPWRVEVTPELCDRLLREGGECDVMVEK